MTANGSAVLREAVFQGAEAVFQILYAVIIGDNYGCFQWIPSFLSGSHRMRKPRFLKGQAEGDACPDRIGAGAYFLQAGSKSFLEFRPDLHGMDICGLHILSEGPPGACTR